MSILARVVDSRVKDVKVTDDSLSVDIMDGRTIVVPLVWYPRLFNASQEQRGNWKASCAGLGIHWPDIDEDLSVEGLLQGIPSREFVSS